LASQGFKPDLTARVTPSPLGRFH